MSITVGELIHALSEMDQDAPVRIAYQPSYPLQMEVQRGLAFRTSRDGQKSVYILGGEQPYSAPYAPSHIYLDSEDNEEDLDEGDE